MKSRRFKKDEKMKWWKNGKLPRRFKKDEKMKRWKSDLVVLKKDEKMKFCHMHDIIDVGHLREVGPGTVVTHLTRTSELGVWNFEIPFCPS